MHTYTTTNEYLIKLHSGAPTLCDSNGTPLAAHDFVVPASTHACLIFSIPDEGPEENLRFRCAGDPAPSEAITWPWNNPPESVQPAAVTAPYKLVTIDVYNPSDRDAELTTSFTLNLRAPDSSISKNFVTIDPTIIQKPDEPMQ